MVQKVRVQDGTIVYTSTDDGVPVNMGVKGNVSVTQTVSVGQDPTADGFIRTLGSGNLILTTNLGKNIILAPDNGRVVLNNVLWPAEQSPNSGAFVGVTSTGTLSYCPFVLGVESSDTVTDVILDTKYPSAMNGQIVLGPNVIYYCVGTVGDRWRIINAGNGNGSLMSIKPIPTSYILQPTDAYDTLLRCTSNTTTTVTVPNDNNVYIPIGAKITISKSGNGNVSIQAQSGVTMYSEGGISTITALFSRKMLIKVGANLWELAN